MSVETEVRYRIDRNLENKDWILEPSNPKRNVFFEAVPKQFQKKLGGKRPDYSLFLKDKGHYKPIAIIEAKKSGSDLTKALEQGIDYAKRINAPLVFASNGSYCETRYVPNKERLKLNGNEVKEFLRQIDALKFLEENSNEVYTIPQEIITSRGKLISIFADLNEILRSEGLRAGIERFSEFANILFLKLLSEHKENSTWENIKKQDDKYLIDHINNTVIKDIQNQYGGEVFSPLQIRKSNTLRKIIDALDPLALTPIDTDIKGNAFEYFLQKTTSTQNDLGEYFTPRHIIKTMVNLVNPKSNEKIYDPFCGTGGFLSVVFNYIRDNSKLDTFSLKQLQEKGLFGREITSTARIAKMNMILHGDGHTGVQQLDSLAKPVDNKYDVVLTNIPFSQKNLPSDLYYDGLAKNNGDSICMLHCFKSLKKGGRMALIVPEGVLFRGELKNVRKFLVDNSNLKTVISLPQGVFLPYTPVKTNILYFTDCHIAKEKKNYWYFEIKNDGYTLDNHRKEIEGENDLNILNSSEIEDKEYNILNDLGFQNILLQDIEKNNYSLIGNSYSNLKNISKSKYKLTALKEVILEIKDGGTPPRNKTESGDYFGGEINWCVVKDIQKDILSTKEKLTEKGLENCSAKLFPKNSIIISLGATIGKVGIARKPTATKQGLSGIIPNSKKVIPEYLYYILKHEKETIEKMATGNTIKEVRPNRLKENLKIPLPSIKKQRAIISQLVKEEKIINKNKKLIKTGQQKIKNIINQLWEN